MTHPTDTTTPSAGSARCAQLYRDLRLRNERRARIEAVVARMRDDRASLTSTASLGAGAKGRVSGVQHLGPTSLEGAIID